MERFSWEHMLALRLERQSLNRRMPASGVLAVAAYGPTARWPEGPRESPNDPTPVEVGRLAARPGGLPELALGT